MAFSAPINRQAAATSNAIDIAFSTNPPLLKRVHDTIAQNPPLASLFDAIATHVQSIYSQASLISKLGEPDLKRRKLSSTADPASLRNGSTAALPSHEKKVVGDVGLGVGFQDTPRLGPVSFVAPQRKKLAIQISARRDAGVRAVSGMEESKVEFGILWEDVAHIACVPVPEKAAVAWNFCVFPNAEAESRGVEAMVWTVAEERARDLVQGQQAAKEVLIRALQAGKPNDGVLQPSSEHFQSAIPQAHRKGEAAYHVKAFRGSKDGFLFFLSHGILWGFKKPLHFFAFADIDTISYTSVLQRTFNLALTRAAAPTSSSTTTTTPNARDNEFEFAMIDQADFVGIEAYVKRHGLHDASMAEQRRAKRLNLNGIRGTKGEADGDGDGEDADGDGVGELERATREAEAVAARAQEDEDEEEEDENFDPGSEGQSEGSGTSDNDDGDDEGNDGNVASDRYDRARDDGQSDEEEESDASQESG